MFIARRFSSARPLTDPLTSIPVAGQGAAAAAASAHVVRGQQLASGVRVVSVTGGAAPSAVGVSVRVEAGSRYETAASAGAAHYLATQGVFGASQARSGLRVTRALENELPSAGGFRVEAGRDALVLHARAVGEGAGRDGAAVALPLLRELLSPRLPEWEVVRAGPRAVRVAGQLRGDLELQALDQCYGAAYRRAGLGRSVVAESNVAALTSVAGVSALRAHVGARFQPANVTVTGLGVADADQFAGQVDQLFASVGADLPARDFAAATGAAASPAAPFVAGGAGLLEAPGATHVALAFHTGPSVSLAQAHVVAALFGGSFAGLSGQFQRGGTGSYRHFIDPSASSVLTQALAGTASTARARVARHGAADQLVLVQAEFGAGQSAAQINEALARFAAAAAVAPDAAAVDRARLLAAHRVANHATTAAGAVELLAEQAVFDGADKTLGPQALLEQIAQVQPADVAQALKALLPNRALGAAGASVGGLQ